MAGPSVEQLWRAVFPQARSVGDTGALSRSVAWVRVLKPRTPAFDALEGDDLAIVPVSTLANLAAIGGEAGTVVDAVTAAGACGVVVVGPGEDPRARQVLSAAPDRALAAFTLDEADVNALERSAISFIVNARAELDARAAALEVDLERAAMAGAGLEGICGVIAAFFARPVAIEADDGTVLAVHSPAGSEAPHVGRYLRGRRGAGVRAPLPSSGTLVLLGAGEMSDLERVASKRIAPLLALALNSAGRPDQPAGERRGDRLPSDGPPWVALIARQIDDDGGPPPDERDLLRAALLRMQPARRLQLRGDATSLELRLVYAARDGEAWSPAELGARVSARIGRPVAISAPFDAPAERAVAEAAARATLEAFEALPATERKYAATSDGGVVLNAGMLPALRLIAGLSAVPDAARHARALLQPLLSGRPSRDEPALATLRAVLDHAGMAEAAAALGIHRNTLAYRLAAIERRTGWRLSDPFVRFGLGLAIRYVQNDQTSAG